MLANHTMRLAFLLISAAAALDGDYVVRKDARIKAEDSCPKHAGGPGENRGSLLGPTHSCSWCAATLAKPDPITEDSKWQAVAFRNEATKPVNIFYLDSKGNEHDARAEAGPVLPGALATFRSQLGNVFRARSVDDHEILLEHRVGRTRLVPEPPKNAGAHDFGVDDTAEWRSTKPASPPLGFKISSAPLAARPKRQEPGREQEDDMRFSVSFLNHAAVPLDLYFFDVAGGTEELQTTLGPFETVDVATYWSHAFVVRDPVSGRRVAQFEIPIIPIRDCRLSSASGAAAAALGEPVAVTVNATDPTAEAWSLADQMSPQTVEDKSI